MSLDELVKVVRELGFPIAVAAFVLWRLEARLRELTHAITALTVQCGWCHALGLGPGQEAGRGAPARPSLPPGGLAGS